MTNVICSAIFVLIAVSPVIRNVQAIECYVCRGCATVTAEDVQTCPPSQETTTQEPITDSDTYFEEPVLNVARNVPLLEDIDDGNLLPDPGVLDNSHLPGDQNFLSRTLMQSTGDDARCLIAVYEEENGQTNVVRSCAIESSNHNSSCTEAIGSNFNGNMAYCKVCAEDLCNSATSTTVAFLLLALGVFFNLA